MSDPADLKTLERVCQELRDERDRLKAENESLRAERDKYRRSLLATLPVATEEEFPWKSLDELLAECDKQSTFEELIAELERTGGA
jgi:hypothetical protein